MSAPGTTGTPYDPPPPGTDLGPLPRRSALGLALQFWLQWLWLVPWGVLVALYFLGALLGAGGDSVGPNIVRSTLTPRRYRLERRGGPQEWEAFAAAELERVGAPALARERERRAANAAGRSRYRHPETDPQVRIRSRSYRGIGAGGLAALAARQGWQVDWARTRPAAEVRLVHRGPLGG
ncbi:hypothetical protein AB0K43_02160 [Kitasatospora sp. NPDC049258]|uniref:hypothetical protein n=1 Tax=Kitasatospora sp. NPDC049258 TaxID=3155394 RepID=UPI0034282AFB